mgnify:CR=1 FL=1
MKVKSGRITTHIKKLLNELSKIELYDSESPELELIETKLMKYEQHFPINVENLLISTYDKINSMRPPALGKDFIVVTKINKNRWHAIICLTKGWIDSYDYNDFVN